jgi:hypothetical protein
MHGDHGVRTWFAGRESEFLTPELLRKMADAARLSHASAGNDYWGFRTPSGRWPGGSDSSAPNARQSFQLFVKASATKPATIARSIQFERFAQSRKRGLLRRSALGLQERAMGEAEFERLLDAVNTAVAPIPQEDFVTGMMALGRQPEAANDNGLAWPLIPFPDGWHATC